MSGGNKTRQGKGLEDNWSLCQMMASQVLEELPFEQKLEVKEGAVEKSGGGMWGGG